MAFIGGGDVGMVLGIGVIMGGGGLHGSCVGWVLWILLGMVGGGGIDGGSGWWRLHGRRIGGRISGVWLVRRKTTRISGRRLHGVNEDHMTHPEDKCKLRTKIVAYKNSCVQHLICVQHSKVHPIDKGIVTCVIFFIVVYNTHLCIPSYYHVTCVEGILRYAIPPKPQQVTVFIDYVIP